MQVLNQMNRASKRVLNRLWSIGPDLTLTFLQDIEFLYSFSICAKISFPYFCLHTYLDPFLHTKLLRCLYHTFMADFQSIFILTIIGPKTLWSLMIISAHIIRLCFFSVDCTKFVSRATEKTIQKIQMQHHK